MTNISGTTGLKGCKYMLLEKVDLEKSGWKTCYKI